MPTKFPTRQAVSMAAFLCLATLHAEPPLAPPAKLPTTPSEVAALAETIEEARVWHERLHKDRHQVSNERDATLNALRNGPFKAAGGLEDSAYRARVERGEKLELQLKANREAAAQAEMAGDGDEKGALAIEAQRLRREKDAALAELDGLVIRRCLALPEAKADAEKARRLIQQAQEATDAARLYMENVWFRWQRLASMYRPKAAGADYQQAREITLPPPADAELRRTAFRERNGEKEMERLAHRLFRALDPKAKGVEPSFRLYAEGRYREALEAFRDHFIHKLAHLEEFGIPPEVIITDVYVPLVTSTFPAQWGEDAMRGVLNTHNHAVSRNELLRIDFGPPGAVHWTYLPKEQGDARRQTESLHLMRRLHLLEAEAIDSNTLLGWLLQSYQKTGEARYLARWGEYADDWALNIQRDLNALPAVELELSGYHKDQSLLWNMRSYHTLIPRVLATFVTRLRAIALTHPDFIKQMPAPTLARVLLTGLEEYVTPNILAARVTRNNWNHMGLSFNVRNSLLLGEFKSAQWLGRETARTLQNHALFSIMPDGGYVEYSDEGHQGVWREYGVSSLELLGSLRAPWFDAALETDLREGLERNGLGLLRHLKPDGLRHLDDYGDARSAYVGKSVAVFGRQSLDNQLPALTQQEEPARMLGTVFGQGTAGTPLHRSDVLPYLGEFLLRGGWKKTDAFLSMNSGRIPNSNDNEDCNGLKLHNHGHHLLTAQPVYVDGRTQNQHFHHVDNVGAKTTFLTHSDGVPIRGRWHTSDHFDLAEGVYEGAYENRVGRVYWSLFRTGGFDMSGQLRAQKTLGLPAVTDVQRHTRQVFFVRDPECWIVVDRIRSDARHDYEVPYEVYTPVQRLDWLRRAKMPIPNMDKRAVIEQSSVHTDNPDFPQISIRHFGEQVRVEFDPDSHDLGHKDGREIAAADREWKSSREPLRDWMAFVRRVLVKWSGEGDQVLVTLVTTAPAPGGRGWDVQGSGTAFTASAPSGSMVHFSAKAHPGELTAGEVRAEADTLLVVNPVSGGGRGMVLGARSLRVRERPMALEGESAEFQLGNSPAVTRAIHAPIQPVKIGPEVNVFTDYADVTMSCDTPGVHIHYTLDGSEPLLQSPAYSRPVRISQSAQVRAIAVRAGAKELHWPLDPGFATLPTRAVFTRQGLSAAQNIQAAVPGLSWEYTEGQPFALVATSGFVPAQKSGHTQRLFDVSMHQSGSAFTARYTGYLNVPADGVYTFHAPREFVIPDCDPGYDLRLFLDGEEWWPAMRQHALGTWSRALAKGAHSFQVIFTDTRTKPFKHETGFNWPNPAVLWRGETPALEISGPGIPRQPIPREWISRETR